MKQLAIIGLLGILLLSGCANQTKSNTAQTTLVTATQTSEQRQLELNIKGLWCESCVYGIQSIMNKTTGITSAEVKITDYLAQTGTAKINYNSSQITKEQIANLTAPYPSEIVKDIPINQ